MSDDGHDDGRYPDLEEYGFLGDCHDWALVHREGSIDWCCFERNEGRTTAARILDWERGGHCIIQPAEESTSSFAYVPDTNVLRTEHRTEHGAIEVTDALLVKRAEEDAAVDVLPRLQLVRRVRCTEGSVPVRAELLPRFDFGLTSAHVQQRSEQGWTAMGGEDALAIWSDLDLDESTWARVAGETMLEEGDERWFSFCYLAPEKIVDGVTETSPEELADGLEHTVEYWQSWAEKCEYEGPYRDAVVRSALVLKALTDANTGAVAAAATTSLPEQVGGERNFDYRFAWMRDASTMLAALYDVGYTAEADAFMQWLGRATAGTADDLQVMYRLSGGRLMPEVELHELEGYRGSAPVRIGNAAAEQFQLDVYGELVSTVWRYHRHGRELSQETIHLLADVLPQLEDVWTDPDAGIWEQRGNYEPFVSSKLYAWRAAHLLASWPRTSPSWTSTPSGAAACVTRSARRSSGTASTAPPTPSCAPSAATPRTRRTCWRSCSTSGTWTIPGRRPRCSRSRTSSPTGRWSTATAWPTGCRATRTPSSGPPSGWSSARHGRGASTRPPSSSSSCSTVPAPSDCCPRSAMPPPTPWWATTRRRSPTWG